MNVYRLGGGRKEEEKERSGKRQKQVGREA